MNKLGKADLLGDFGQGFGIHQCIQPKRKLALGCGGKGIENKIGDDETQNSVAEEFEPFIVRSRSSPGAGMGKRSAQPGMVAE